MKKLLVLIGLVIVGFESYSARVDTVTIFSQAMHKELKCVVISPKKKGPLPVVYLLHGHSGDYSNWIKKVPELKNYADKFGLIIVCPDGHYSSWYFDSPVDSTMKYETYIGKEVPEYIDKHYPTIRDRKARAITGLSMGGHGALFIAFRHAQVFAACGSMSGGVDLKDLKTKYDIYKRLGDTLNHADNWVNYSVSHVIETYPKESLAIIFDCGTEDFFYPVNHALHEKMLLNKIPHDYIERPGKHDWVYWANSVEFQLLFFSHYFQRNLTQQIK